MRIARFTTGDEPQFGVIGNADGIETIAHITGDPIYAGIELTGDQTPLDEVRLLAPVIPRSKVVCVGRNYAAHAAELGNEVPERPMIFLKPNTAVIGPGDPIVYPDQSSDVQFEGELAVVIGRICRDVPADAAASVIHGYTIANDVTARDLQALDGQWARAKGFDTFCPLGPWIETDLDTSALVVRTTLGGQTKQEGSTADWIFDLPTVIEYVTSFMTLLPGDVILTGTPEGVGPMQVGDEVAVSVEGIGTLTNKVVARD